MGLEGSRPARSAKTGTPCDRSASKQMIYKLIFNNRTLEIIASLSILFLLITYRPLKKHTISKYTNDLFYRTLKYSKKWFNYIESAIITGALGYFWFNTRNLLILFLFLISTFLTVGPIYIILRMLMLNFLKRNDKNLKGYKMILLFVVAMIMQLSITLSIINIIFDLTRK